jgi:hypothetical protein
MLELQVVQPKYLASTVYGVLELQAVQPNYLASSMLELFARTLVPIEGIIGHEDHEIGGREPSGDGEVSDPAISLRNTRSGRVRK